MNNKLCTLIMTLFCISHTWANILEHHTLYGIEQFLAPYASNPEQALIIFDIDNTLAAPEKSLGSDEWITHMIQQAIDRGLTYEHALHDMLPLYFHIQSCTPLITMEPDTASYIKELQKRGFPTIGLTARGLYIAERTVMQLREIGIQLGLEKHFQRDFYYSLPPHNIPAILRAGILFSGSNDKGKILMALLKDIGLEPHLIIFVDDKLKNIHAVEQAAQDANIDFIGIHYTGCNQRVARFDPIQADQELQEFYKEHNPYKLEPATN